MVWKFVFFQDIIPYLLRWSIKCVVNCHTTYECKGNFFSSLTFFFFLLKWKRHQWDSLLAWKVTVCIKNNKNNKHLHWKKEHFHQRATKSWSKPMKTMDCYAIHDETKICTCKTDGFGYIIKFRKWVIILTEQRKGKEKKVYYESTEHATLNSKITSGLGWHDFLWKHEWMTGALSLSFFTNPHKFLNTQHIF